MDNLVDLKLFHTKYCNVLKLVFEMYGGITTILTSLKAYFMAKMFADLPFQVVFPGEFSSRRIFFYFEFINY